MKNHGNEVSLVTGGAGFIGSHVVDHLLSMNHKVIALDDLSGGFERNVNKNAIFVKGSILDNQVLAEILIPTRLIMFFTWPLMPLRD